MKCIIMTGVSSMNLCISFKVQYKIFRDEISDKHNFIQKNANVMDINVGCQNQMIRFECEPAGVQKGGDGLLSL